MLIVGDSHVKILNLLSFSIMDDKIFLQLKLMKCLTCNAGLKYLICYYYPFNLVCLLTPNCYIMYLLLHNIFSFCLILVCQLIFFCFHIWCQMHDNLLMGHIYFLNLKDFCTSQIE